MNNTTQQVLTSAPTVEAEVLQAERDGVCETANKSAVVQLWRSFAYSI